MKLFAAFGIILLAFSAQNSLWAEGDIRPMIEYNFNTPKAIQKSTGSEELDLTLEYKDGSIAELIDTQEGSGMSGVPSDLCLDMTKLRQNMSGIVSGNSIAALDNLATFTITGWAKDCPVQSEFSARIIGNVSRENPSAGFVLYLTGTALSLQVDGEIIDGNGVYDMSVGKWRFWAVTFDANVGEVVFYYAGESGAPTSFKAKTTALRSSATDGPLVIGNNAGGQRPVLGRFDNVRIFAAALSAEQITQIRDKDLENN